MKQSSQSLQLGPLVTDRGERASGMVDLQISDRKVRLPVILVNGAREGPRLSVTAGIHGGEYPCVEAAVRLAKMIAPENLAGELIILPSSNPIAFWSRSIYVTPVDGKNLNRQFPGDTGGSFTDIWADWLFNNVIARSNAYVDLHGGDMIEALVPFVAFDISGDDHVDNTARRMAESFGIKYALGRKTVGGPTGTTISAAAAAGVPALLAEAGGQGVWDEASVELLRSGVLRVMDGLGMLETAYVDSLVSTKPESIHWLEGWSWLRAETDGLFYPDVSVGDMVTEGQHLGRIAGFFGETKQEIAAPASGIVLFLVTSLAMNQGDPLLAVAF